MSNRSLEADGAETFELVGCYILSRLTQTYGDNIGLSRDDGFPAFNKTPKEIERIKRDLCKIFRDNDLKMTVDPNLTRVNFLNVSLHLKSGKHLPYTKEGNIPLYVHKQSNHPPSILRNIPESINKRLSEISDKECFHKARTTYQDALNESGYKYNLSYKKINPHAPKTRRNRQGNVTWFNPSYSQNVETKVGKCFLSLIDHHFPKSNPAPQNL